MMLAFNTSWFVTFLIIFGYGVWLFTKALVHDCKRDLQTLDKMAKYKKSKAEKIKQLTTFIRSHSNLKQLSKSIRFSVLTKENKQLSFLDGSRIFRIFMKIPFWLISSGVPSPYPF